MTEGESLLNLAITRVGQKYVNVCVPKNNPNWKGPWDCAEFISWLVYQVGGKLYGCVNNNGNPATVEAYTGAWQTDSANLGIRIPWQQAASTVGGILLRFPPSPGKMGHIAVSDGQGGTVEAMGKKWGVVKAKSSGRSWNTGVLIPQFSYPATIIGLTLSEPKVLYAVGQPNMDPAIIRRLQQALSNHNIDPGPIDGIFGENTQAAVAAFQATKGIVVDGQVGRQTARALGVKLT